MPRFRAILATRFVGPVKFNPSDHNPTGLGNIIRHREVYETFTIDGKQVDATEELCGKIEAAIEKKYGQKLVAFEVALSANELASERKELAELRALKAAAKLPNGKAAKIKAEAEEAIEKVKAEASAAIEKANREAEEVLTEAQTEIDKARGMAERLKAAVFPVNANTGSLVQLTLVPGIGEATAEKIIARRAEKPFDTLAELATISPTTLNPEKLAEHVAL